MRDFSFCTLFIGIIQVLANVTSLWALMVSWESTESQRQPRLGRKGMEVDLQSVDQGFDGHTRVSQGSPHRWGKRSARNKGEVRLLDSAPDFVRGAADSEVACFSFSEQGSWGLDWLLEALKKSPLQRPGGRRDKVGLVSKSAVG